MLPTNGKFSYYNKNFFYLHEKGYLKPFVYAIGFPYRWDDNNNVVSCLPILNKMEHTVKINFDVKQWFLTNLTIW